MHKLRKFLNKDIKMNKIYQPMVIKCLLKWGGTADIKDVAIMISEKLHGHRGKTSYYVTRLNMYPKKTLNTRGIATVIPGTKAFKLMSGYYIQEEKERHVTIKLCDSLIDQVLEREVSAKRNPKSKKKEVSNTWYTPTPSKAEFLQSIST